MRRWMAMAGISWGLVITAGAQTATPLRGKVSVNWQGIAVSDALRDLGAKVNAEFVFEGDSLFKGFAPVTLKRDGVEAGRIAMRILRPYGLTLENAEGRRPTVIQADPYATFKVQREEVFAFARKPTLTRHGDDVTVMFETKGWCDVTVAVEDETGRIVRHLASGVPGLNAPEPFIWNSKAQTLLWDGKDDAGVYVDDKDRVRIRVSLGLKPRFERTLYWHPAKRAGRAWSMAAGPEGMFVFNSGTGIDHVRLFNRDGEYRRTVYPFPADKVGGINGLTRYRFPDGAEIPIKPNWLQTSLLISGNNAYTPTYRDGRYSGHQSKRIAGGGMRGGAGHDLAVRNGRMALTGHRFSRFMSEGGGIDGLSVHGPNVAFKSDKSLWKTVRSAADMQVKMLCPERTALSPDGQWLYLARYNITIGADGGVTLWRHRIKRVRYEGDGPPEVFAGSVEKGSADGEFDMPADVACDPQGRVYVADHRNDRVQVFDADGTHLRNIPVRRPALLNLHPKTGDLYVFSWALPISVGRNSYWGTRSSLDHEPEDRQTYFRLSRFSAYEKFNKIEAWDLQKATGLTRTWNSNIEIVAALDFYADPLRLWITAPSPVGARRNRHGLGLVILALEDGAWTVKRDLLDEAASAVHRTSAAAFNRQRLYVNPVDGILYIGEATSRQGKSYSRVLRVDPDTGRIRKIELPLNTEDMAFDRDGHIYLRTANMIMRYDAQTWREIPFDYGEERQKTGYADGGGDRATRVISGAMFPGNRGWHHGGMHVNVRGDIVVSTLYSVELETRQSEARVHDGTSYQPRMYPGRRYNPGGRFGGAFVHILDRFGKLICADALPGLNGWDGLNGVALDARGDLYVLHASPAMIGSERHFNDHTGTLMKFTPGEGRLLSKGGTPIPLAEKPERAPDLYRATAWVEGAHWLQPGIGWSCNYTTGCACWNTRFSFDYFARSFVPEVDRYSIGVLDSAGNLMVRMGRYGNVDDGMPLVKDGGPPQPRAVGGDEIALKHAPYLAVDTDNRVFVADPGNARIVSVKLGYHAAEIVALKDVPDEGKKRAPGVRVPGKGQQ